MSTDIQQRTQEHDVQIADNYEAAMQAFGRVFEAVAQERPELASLMAHGWEMVKQADAAYQAKIAILMQMLDEAAAERNQLIEAREQLEAEIADPHGATHPAIQKMIETLNDDLEEHYQHLLADWKDLYMDELVNDAMEEATDEVFGELAERIAEQLDVDEFNAHTLLELLTGESSYQINDDHARALLALQEEIEKWNATQRRMRRAAILDFLNENELAQSS